MPLLAPKNQLEGLPCKDIHQHLSASHLRQPQSGVRKRGFGFGFSMTGMDEQGRNEELAWLDRSRTLEFVPRRQTSKVDRKVARSPPCWGSVDSTVVALHLQVVD